MNKYQIGNIIGTDITGPGYVLNINVVAKITNIDNYNYTYIITQHSNPSFVGRTVVDKISIIDRDWILINND